MALVDDFAAKRRFNDERSAEFELLFTGGIFSMFSASEQTSLASFIDTEEEVDMQLFDNDDVLLTESGLSLALSDADATSF